MKKKYKCAVCEEDDAVWRIDLVRDDGTGLPGTYEDDGFLCHECARDEKMKIRDVVLVPKELK